MRKRLFIVLATCALLTMGGCSSSTSESKEKDVQEGIEETSSVQRFSYDGEEVGSGSFFVVTASGSSEEGNTPVLYTTKDTISQIGIEGWDMDGSLKSFIYVDGILNTTEQLSNSQSTITINGADFETGTYKVECVQYADNDENGDIVFYRSVELKIDLD